MELTDLQYGQVVQIKGTISQVTPKVTKQGRTLAVVMLKDCDGAVEALCFPDVYDKYKQVLTVDSVVIVTGPLDPREDKPKIYADEVVECNRGVLKT